MKTAVIAIAKNENHYIREWVEYNKGIGFTNVILYDNFDELLLCFSPHNDKVLGMNLL